MEIITANELISGATLYYLGENDWGADIDRAYVFFDRENELVEQIVRRGRESGRLISLERENVRVVEGKVLAIRLRERIRANGPTSPRHLPQMIAAEAGGGARHVSL